MKPYRHEKIRNFLIHELSDIIQRDLKDPSLSKGIISVSEVSLSADLRYADILISVYEGEPDKVLKTLEKAKGYIRGLLSRRSRMRIVPELRFKLDQRLDMYYRIEELLEADRKDLEGVRLMVRTIRDIPDSEIKGKRFLVRVDYNVPLKEVDGGREVADDSRITATYPTLNYLLERGAKLIVCSHLGRPKGKVVKELSLEPVYHYLREATSRGDLKAKDVKFSPETVGDTAKEMALGLSEGELLLLENTRFNPGEEANDPEFAKALASLAEAFVIDAFGTLHRVHASTGGVIEYLPSYVGLLIERELSHLNKLLDPEKPYVVILGGAKVSDKIKVIKALLEKADELLIGGAMAFTFLKSLGKEVGRSLVEDDYLDVARELLSSGKIVLPVDVVVTDDIKNPKVIKTVSVDEMPPDLIGADIGPETVNLFSQRLEKAKTVFWNGPMGVFEVDQFAKGSEGIAHALAELRDALTVVGGGDSAACVRKLGYEDKVSFVSTGGGATLKFLERDGKLPVLELLKEKAPS